MTRIKKKDTIIYIAQLVLFALLVIFVLLMISRIESIQGNARVVNYAGMIRGSTQRLAKLELSHQPADDLIIYIDGILNNLQTGAGDYRLGKLNDAAYLKELEQLSAAWAHLKQEVFTFRQGETEASALLSLSEDFFVLADDMVSAAEIYSEGEAQQLRLFEAALITCIILILLLVAKQIASVFLLNRKNRELNKMAYIDANTGLPNKGRCDQVICNFITETGKQYACVMFDLNNLKQTNDRYGHKVGDELIYNFAGILLGTASEKVFTGRYGGDEFIAILSDTDTDEVTAFLNNVETKVQYFNNSKAVVPISVAHGYAMAVADEGFSLQALLMKADEKMYRNKAYMKSKSADT